MVIFKRQAAHLNHHSSFIADWWNILYPIPSTLWNSSRTLPKRFDIRKKLFYVPFCRGINNENKNKQLPGSLLVNLLAFNVSKWLLACQLERILHSLMFLKPDIEGIGAGYGLQPSGVTCSLSLNINRLEARGLRRNRAMMEGGDNTSWTPHGAWAGYGDPSPPRLAGGIISTR